MRSPYFAAHPHPAFLLGLRLLKTKQAFFPVIPELLISVRWGTSERKERQNHNTYTALQSAFKDENHESKRVDQ